MSLFGGKLGGFQRTLTYEGKLWVLNPEETDIPVVEFTPDEARRLLELLKGKQAEKQTFPLGVGFDAPGNLKLRPFVAAVWTMTPGDTWRVTGESRVLFIGWEDEGIASFIETSWRGGMEMLHAVRRHLKDIIEAKPFYSARETASEIGYSQQWVNAEAANGRIRGAFQNSSGWQIPAGWVEWKKGQPKGKPGPKPKKE